MLHSISAISVLTTNVFAKLLEFRTILFAEDLNLLTICQDQELRQTHYFTDATQTK